MFRMTTAIYPSKKYWIFPALLLMVTMAFQVTAVEVVPPQQIIKTTSDRLLEILRNERERLKAEPSYVYQLAKDILLPHIDFGKAATLVLGKYWRRATQQQRTAFAEQFQRLLIRTYATSVHELSAWDIRYLPLRLKPEQKRIMVRTQILRDSGQPVAVDYRMHLAGDHWKIYDVTIEGVSLVTNYRTSFSNLVRRLGMDGLIQRLTELNNTRVGQSKAQVAVAVAEGKS